MLDVASPPQQQQPMNQNGSPFAMNSPFGMEVPPASPFGASLFKTRDGDPGTAAPVALRGMTGGSPFSPGIPAQAPGLTVADVLPKLPPELARMNSLPPEHQIQIAPHIIEAGLNNGQAAIPIFEVYRVCPAIFQTPVSPQDPRQVPLPAAKLPSLIAASQGGQPPQQQLSPFAQAMPAAVPSPFGNLGGDVATAAPLMQATMPQPQGGVVLPPRRENGVPPAMPGASASPFGTSAAMPPPLPGQQGPSPFGMQALGAEASPFSSQPAQASAPRSEPMPFAGAPFQGSPFQSSQPAPAAPAFGTPGPSAQKPLTGTLVNSLFEPQVPAAAQPAPFQVFGAPPAMPQMGEPMNPPPYGASPFSQSQPAPSAPPPFALTEAPQPAREMTPPPPLQSTPPPGPAPVASGPMKLSLASVLKGYSSTDLGFDPGMVPSWIMTTVPGGALRGHPGAGPAQIELGQLIDGTTDVGFRNVLSSARRDLLVALPGDAPSGSSPASASPAPAAMAPPLTPPQVVIPSAPPATSMETPTNPFAAAKAAAAAAATRSGPLNSLGTPAALTGPIQPKANVNFGLPVQPPAPEMAAAPAQSQPKAITSFDPFATSSAQSWGGQVPPAPIHAAEGFSSDQLFGTPAPTTTPSAMHPQHVPTPAPLPQASEPPAFSSLPGVPPPPAAQHFGSMSGSPMPGLASAPSLLPPPVPNPFSGPLKEMAAPSFSQTPPPYAAPVPFPAAAAPSPVSPPLVAAPVIPAAPAAVVGITAVVPGDTEQIMLRALLGVNEDLTVSRVVELVSKMPGVAACACIHGPDAVSRGASTGAAHDFQQQAAELARNIHALAPLIGIAGAETFSVNTSERLMTFSFHQPVALGVLHDGGEPAAGLRDKITLLGREISRMAIKAGGRIS